MSLPPNTETISNTAAQKECASIAIEQITGKSVDEKSITINSLSANNYSFTFSIGIESQCGHQDFFVKIPKTDLRGSAKTILPISAGDRHMAEEEIASLQKLNRLWENDELNVSWAHIRCVIPKFNAIITDRIFAAEALSVFRKLDLRRRIGFKNDGKRIQNAMARFGAALGKFHKKASLKNRLSIAKDMPKLERYYSDLLSSAKSPCLNTVINFLRSLAHVEFEAITTPTLKGIDIRNILIDDQDRLYILDPGKMKQTPREADLARFLMTYRILFWGSKLLFLGLLPDSKGETAFLDAYYANNFPANTKLLNYYMLKEQLKHWHTAMDSLEKFSWPKSVKRLVTATYVNPFYTRQMTEELKKAFL